MNFGDEIRELVDRVDRTQSKKECDVENVALQDILLDNAQIIADLVDTIDTEVSTGPLVPGGGVVIESAGRHKIRRLLSLLDK